jgi:hypothetical protein
MTNIIETIQKNLDYPAVKKIDPNIQETTDNYKQTKVEKLAQAAIPAVLAGLYRLSRKNDCAEQIIHLQANNNAGLLPQIFDGQENTAVEKVARYGDASETEVKNHMEIIAGEAIRLIRKEVGENANGVKVKSYLSDQRHNVLSYLPAAMQFRDLLDDDTLDDRTNKMEGPVSNLMHKIEDKLSGSGG